MRYALAIVGALALMASAAYGQGYNPSGVGQGIVGDCTVVIASTGTPQQVLARSGTPGAVQGNRTKVILQNLALSRTMGFSFIMGSSLAIASSQQFVLVGITSSGTNMWQSGPDLVPMNSIFVVGTTNDVLSCVFTGP